MNTPFIRNFQPFSNKIHTPDQSTYPIGPSLSGRFHFHVIFSSSLDFAISESKTKVTVGFRLPLYQTCRILLIPSLILHI